MIYTPKEFCESLIRDALNIETTFEHLPKSCADCIINGHYKEMLDYDKKPFRSFKQFCEYRLPYGMALEWSVLLKISEKTKYREIILAQEVIDEPLKEQGRPEGENKPDNVSFNSSKYGNSQSYLLRRLARDGQNEPDKAELFKQVTKGEISAHKAALVAGYRTKKTPLESAKKALQTLTDDEFEMLYEQEKERRNLTNY